MRLRFTSFGFAAAVLLLCTLLPSADALPQLSFSIRLERVPGSTTLRLTLSTSGTDSIRLVAIRGSDFSIVSANVVSGGPASCAVSGSPATLTCRDFEVRRGKALAVQIATTGTPRQALEAVTDGHDPGATEFFPLDVMDPQPSLTGSLTRLGKARLRISITNTGVVAFKKVWFTPRGKMRFVRVLSVKHRRLAARTGDGCKLEEPGTPGRPKLVACHADVGAGETFIMILSIIGAGPRDGVDATVETADHKFATLNL